MANFGELAESSFVAVDVTAPGVASAFSIVQKSKTTATVTFTPPALDSDNTELTGLAKASVVVAAGNAGVSPFVGVTTIDAAAALPSARRTDFDLTTADAGVELTREVNVAAFGEQFAVIAFSD